jgi:nicotinamidase-related amidase
MSRLEGAPALADEQDAFREAYVARVPAFMEAGRQVGLPSAGRDTERIALVLVDYQHDFTAPTGTLSVPGAQEDVARLLRWFYASAPRITTIYASLDTHLPAQIFFGAWWSDPRSGAPPPPFTPITADDVLARRWEPLREAPWSQHYVQILAQQARKDLMIWPYHTMQGTLGHMLAAPISEAIAWHSAARGARPVYITKGLTPRTEFYGIFGAEVPDPSDTSSNLNVPLLNQVMQHDRVYIAGEARSHCVLETIRQLVGYLRRQPELLTRLYVLTDCTSSVQHPTIDFDALAGQELALLQEQGVHLVKSTHIVP